MPAWLQTVVTRDPTNFGESDGEDIEIRSGRRTVATQDSVSPLQAVVDYTRSLGCKDDEIRRLGTDSVSWRGARFSAVLAPIGTPEPRLSKDGESAS